MKTAMEYWIVCIWVLLCFLNCNTPKDPVAGGGLDTPNAPSCLIKGTIGLGANAGLDNKDNITIKIYEIKSNTNACPSWNVIDSTKTDAEGNYELDSIASGCYALTFKENMAFYGYLALDENDTIIFLDTILLYQPKNINGILIKNNFIKSDDIIIGLIGIPVYDTLLSDTTFEFNNVPVGNYKMCVMDNKGINNNCFYMSFPVIYIDSLHIGWGKFPISYTEDYTDFPINTANQVDSIIINGIESKVSSDSFTLYYLSY